MTTLRLSFPSTTDQAQILAGLRGLLTSVGRPDRLGAGRRFLCLEIWAADTGITHLVTAPRGQSAISVLTSAMPGVRIEKVERPTGQLTGIASGVRLAGPTPGIVRTDISTELSSTLLSNLSELRSGEVVVLQWLVAPLARTRLPFTGEEELDRTQREKRSDTEVVATGRIGAWAANSRRASSLVFTTARVLRSVGGASGGLRIRKSGRVATAIEERRAPTLIWPSHLNVIELAGLIGWPSAATPIRGLVRGASRLLPLPTGAPNSGPSIGVTTFPGDSAPIRLGTSGRLRHLHVVGPTGVGKTTLLTHLIAADIRSGRSVIVFDPLGDLTDRVCERIPADRQDDLVVVDPTDTDLPVGLNVLAGSDRYRTTDFVVAVMARLFASSWGPRTADVLRASLLTLTTKAGATLADLPDVLTNPAFRRQYTSKVMADRTLAGFWTWYDGMSDAERASVIAPVLNKVRAVVLRPEAVRVLCHADGQLQLSDVFTRRRIVVVRLAKGLVGEETAGLIGGLILAKLWQTVLARAAIEPERRHSVFFYLDEFQDYLRLPIGVGDMLAQARGMGVGLVVAHQHLGQLPDAVRRDVLSNVGSRVIFQTTADDARLLARDLEPHLTAHDLRGLGAREIVARIASPERVLPPVTGRTVALDKPTSDPNRVRNRSRTRYGRPLPERPQPSSSEAPVGRRRRNRGEL